MRRKPRLDAQTVAARVDLITGLMALPFLTIDEVSIVIGLPPSTIRSLCADGRLEGVKAGRRWNSAAQH